MSPPDSTRRSGDASFVRHVSGAFEPWLRAVDAAPTLGDKKFGFSPSRNSRKGRLGISPRTLDGLAISPGQTEPHATERDLLTTRFGASVGYYERNAASPKEESSPNVWQYPPESMADSFSRTQGSSSPRGRRLAAPRDNMPGYSAMLPLGSQGLPRPPEGQFDISPSRNSRRGRLGIPPSALDGLTPEPTRTTPALTERGTRPTRHGVSRERAGAVAPNLS
eukprot:4474950-Prymnesium_polylepis.2